MLRIESANVEKSRLNCARTLRIAFADIDNVRPNGARTLRIASTSVEKVCPKSARTLRIAIGGVEKSPPNGARTLRIASASVEKSHQNGARTSPTCCLNDASRHGSAPARYALQRRQVIYGRASAPPSCGARAAKKNGLISGTGKRALFWAPMLRYGWLNFERAALHQQRGLELLANSMLKKAARSWRGAS